MAVLPDAVVSKRKAVLPTAVLCPPVVAVERAFFPTATL